MSIVKIVKQNLFVFPQMHIGKFNNPRAEKEFLEFKDYFKDCIIVFNEKSIYPHEYYNWGITLHWILRDYIFTEKEYQILKKTKKVAEYYGNEHLYKYLSGITEDIVRDYVENDIVPKIYTEKEKQARIEEINKHNEQYQRQIVTTLTPP